MSERTPPFSPSITLLTVARTVESQLERALEPHGITLRKYAVLGHIAGSPGLSVSELARRSGITVQSMHTLIRSLHEAGLVESVDPAPGRAADLRATAAGTALLARLGADVGRIDASTFSGPELAALRIALAELHAARVRERE
jgi:DNA-binding MarR family transcriptional regulator